RIGKNCRVGPLAYLGPGTVLEDGSEAGPTAKPSKSCSSAGERESGCCGRPQRTKPTPPARSHGGRS
ncbi:MAG TPA: hypothetical protein VMY69_01405, partial [Phycisphaerae bacterium]|nr:hypothetical protein [Phycisphaerae bacterium]